jgi:hypothetical protein
MQGSELKLQIAKQIFLKRKCKKVSGITFNLFSFSHTMDRIMESTIGENMRMNIKGKKPLEIQSNPS